MKNIILTCFILTLFSTSCSPDYITDGSTNSSSKITPPDWIIGSWYYYYDTDDVNVPSPNMGGYKFYKDDICLLTVTSSEACIKEAINIYKGTQITTKVEQEITESKYKCVITIASGVNNFHFEKIDSQTIKDVNTSNTVGRDVILKKQ